MAPSALGRNDQSSRATWTREGRVEKQSLQRTTSGRSLFDQVVEMFGACIKQGDMRRQSSASPRRGLAQGKLDRDFEAAGIIMIQAVATNS